MSPDPSIPRPDATTRRLGQGPRRGRETAWAQPSVLYADEHGGRFMLQVGEEVLMKAA
jgi:hypothetical protein